MIYDVKKICNSTKKFSSNYRTNRKNVKEGMICRQNLDLKQQNSLSETKGAKARFRICWVFDKEKNENVLYTNDIIRPSNLATRNAWFSGGVEWNLSIIGHTPFTMDQIYTAKLNMENGTPVLRMYEYERIRQVVYQMDFWLEEDENVLNCRMRIENTSDQEIPMYWWSNAAVPEYEGGRIIVPAEQAYSNNASEILKLDIPMVDGVDVRSSMDRFRLMQVRQQKITIMRKKLRWRRSVSKRRRVICRNVWNRQRRWHLAPARSSIMGLVLQV